jgi:hypothetical protein
MLKIGNADAVNDFQPDVLFVGMTAPKQEKWSYQYKAKLMPKLFVPSVLFLILCWNGRAAFIFGSN